MSKAFDILKGAGLLVKEAMRLGRSQADALAYAEQEIHEFFKVSDVDMFSAEHFIAAAPLLGVSWLECGFPCVEVSAKLAASLMCTKITPDLVSGVPLPWSCFSIRIPEDLLGFREVLLRDSPAYGKIFIIKDAADGTSVSGSTLVEEAELPDNNPHHFSDARWARERLLGRLITGVVIEMVRHRPSPDNLSYGSRSNGRGGAVPTSWTFRLTRPVKMDVRPAIKEWLGGARGGSLALQHMVHGHHKTQACGPGGADRKWIHIEPYWRGDPDAAIALRNHIPGDGT